MSSRGYGHVRAHHRAADVRHGRDATRAATPCCLGDDEAGPVRVPGHAQGRPRRSTRRSRGKAPMPAAVVVRPLDEPHPYFSEDEVRGVRRKLRANRIPSDVIHLDTGWFETDWRYGLRVLEDALQATREDDRGPQARRLPHVALAASVLQCPRTASSRRSWRRACVRARQQGEAALRGRRASTSQPDDRASGIARKIAGARCASGVERDQGGLRRGGAARPASTPRAAAASTSTTSTRCATTRSVADVTQEVNGREHHLGPQRLGGQPALSDPLGRRRRARWTSAWPRRCAAGSRSEPRGFTFWSHDIGGFLGRQGARTLYRRWVPFGMLTSHSRSHGTAAARSRGSSAPVPRRLSAGPRR